MSTSDNTTKICTGCGNEKPATAEYFHRSNQYPDGLRHLCKICRKKTSHNYYEENKERLLKEGAEWRKKNPDKVRAAWDRFEVNNPDKVAKAKQDYSRTRAAEIFQKTKRYREENPDIYQAHLAVTGAVLSGRLPKVRTQSCVECSNQARHYHHWSYLPEHRLDVKPLCLQCHKNAHKKETNS